MAGTSNKRKRRGIGRKYKSGTHCNNRKHNTARTRDNVATSNNQKGRPRHQEQVVVRTSAISIPDNAIKNAPVVLSPLIITGEESLSSLSTSTNSAPTPLPKFNNQTIDFTKVASIPINQEAYSQRKDGTERTVLAARKAIARDVTKITSAINSVEDVEHRVLALHKALCHPSMREVAKSAGFDPVVCKVAKFNTEQMSKVLQRSRDVSSAKSRGSEDVKNFSQALLLGIAASPELTNSAPSRRQQVESVGLSWSTGRRLFAQSVEHRQKAKNDPTVKLVKSSRKKGFTRITPEVIEQVQKWITAHDFVIDSPIAKDTLKVYDPETGKKTKTVGKLLLQIPIRELHNDLVAAAEKGDLPGLLDANGKIIVSDTSL
jgi:hypothetical protein